MKKKVLLPIMMVGPLAMPALADVTMVMPGEWTQSGTTGNENAWSSTIDDLTGYTNISCALGTGVVTQKLDLPAGTYSLTFDPRNTVNAQFSVNGTEVKPNGTGIITFTVADGTETVLRIEAADKTQRFSFQVQKLSLEFNETAAVDALRAQLGEIAQLQDVVAEDTFQQAVDLREWKTRLETAMTTYNGESFDTVFEAIASIKSVGTSTDEDIKKCLELYTKYGLDKDPSAVSAYITKVADEVDEYNKAVEAENATWHVYTDNVATLNTLKGEQATLLTNANALVEAIAAWVVDDPAVKAGLTDEAAALVTEIENYGKAIDTAYPLATNPEALRVEITFENLSESLQAKIDELNGKFETKKADYEVYYNVNFTLMTGLKDAYDKYIAALDAAEGVKGYEDVYAGKVETDKTAATDLYNETRANNQIESVDGAKEANEANHYVANINAAIDKMKADMEAFNNLVATQNENMTEAQGIISDNRAEISYDGKVPARYTEEFDSKQAAAKEAIDALEDYVVGKYTAHELSLDDVDYIKLKNAADMVVDEFKELVALFAPINDLQAALDQAKKDVEGMASPVLGEGGLYTKFTGTFDALQDAINALEGNEDESVLNEIKTQIDNAVKNAGALNQAFNDATDYINGFDADLKALHEFVDAKKIGTVEEVQNLKANFDYQEFEQLLAKYNADLAAAAAAEAQASWKQIQDLNKILENSTLTADMDKAKVEFASKATDANLAAANAQFDAVYKQLTDAKAAGVTGADGVAVTDLMALLSELASDVESAKAADDACTELGKCDDKIENAMATISERGKYIQSLVDNQNAYDALVVLSNNLQASLDEAKQYNDANSLPGGKEYYAENVFPGLQTKIDELNDALKASLDNHSVLADKTGETGFDAQIEAIAGEIKDARQAVVDNNTNHANQLVREKEVRTYIEQVIAEIEANTNAAGLAVVKDWLTELNDLISNNNGTPNLADVNITVTQAYGNGESAKQNPDIMAAYDEIYNLAKAVQDKFQGDDFHNAVISANETTTDNWGSFVSGLDDDYLDAIRQYNYFFYDLTNEGWKAYVLEDLKRHESIFQYYSKIKDLDAEAKAWFAEQNLADHVITAEEYQEWLDKAAVIETDIRNDVYDDADSLMNSMDALARAYYASLHGQAESDLTDAASKLSAAGIPDSYLDNAKNYMTLAENAYGRNLGEREFISKNMDEIAGLLDQVFANIDLQKFAEDAWKTEYTAAQNEIDELRAEIEGYKDADPEVRSAWLEYFGQTVLDVTALNNTVQGVKENLIDSYGAYSDDLDALLENLRNCRDEVKKSNDLNTENKQIYDDFVAGLPGLYESLQNLREYAEAMGGCSSMIGAIDNIKTEIDKLSELVEAHRGNLLDLDIAGRVEAVKNNIAQGYENAAKAEMAYLRTTLLKNVKVAFNDAVLNNGTLPEGQTFDAIDARITEIGNELERLVYTDDSKDDFKTSAVEFEQELCSLYVMLQGSWSEGNPNQYPAVDLLAGLDSRYQAISDAISAGQTYLDGCLDSVKEQYAGENNPYTTLQTQLDQQHSGWQAEGDNIISRADYYNLAMNDIVASLDKVNAEIKAAQEAAQAELDKQNASNERYAELKAEYDSLAQEFNAVQTMVDGYSEEIQQRYALLEETIQNKLDAALAELEAALADFSLTDESTLANAAEISQLTQTLKLNATRAHAQECLAKTEKADKAVSDALRTHIVPDARKEIAESYAGLHSELQTLLNDVTGADFDGLTAIISRADELAGEFDDLLGKIQDNTYVPGDLNDAPDGEVNVTDVQILINWVGERKTLADLTPVQAAAADLNGDGELNISDITALINLVLDQDESDENTVNRAPRLLLRGVNDGGGIISATYMETNDGVRRYAVALQNAQQFVSGQIDIVATGEIVEVSLGERAAAHDLYVFDNGESTRVIMASMANDAISGVDGEILYIDVRGTLDISKAVFADADARAYNSDVLKPTFIESIMENVRDTKDTIYNVAGQTMRKVQRGINIIRHSDGSTTKEYKK